MLSKKTIWTRNRCTPPPFSTHRLADVGIEKTFTRTIPFQWRRTFLWCSGWYIGSVRTCTHVEPLRTLLNLAEPFCFWKKKIFFQKKKGSKRFSQVQQGSKRFNVCAGSNRTDGPPRTPRKGSPPRTGSVQVQVFWIRRSAMWPEPAIVVTLVV